MFCHTPCEFDAVEGHSLEAVEVKPETVQPGAWAPEVEILDGHAKVTYEPIVTCK